MKSISVTFVLAALACVWMLGTQMLSEINAQSTQPAASADEPPGDKKAEPKPTPIPEKKDQTATKEDGETKDDDDKKAESDKKDGKKTPETVEAKKAPIKAEVTLSGKLAADETHEIKLMPEKWSAFEIVSVVEHGTLVNKGDVLIRFKTKDIDEKISDLEAALEIGELSQKLASLEYEASLELAELELAQAKRQTTHNKDDYQYFTQTEEPFTRKMAEFSLRMSEEQMAYAKEELDQLKKMYEADDLTEETEEIILRRTQFEYEMAKLGHERSQMNYERIMSTTLPRMIQTRADAFKTAEISSEKQLASIPVMKARRDLQFTKSQEDEKMQKEELEQLQKDRSNLFEIKAAADGVVYYGQLDDGKLASATTIEKMLQIGANAAPKTVLMTLTPAKPTLLLAAVDEKDVRQLKSGMAVTITPTASKSSKLIGKITSISTFPGSDGNFPIKVALEPSPATQGLVTTMSATAKIVTYLNESATTLPPEVVFTEDLDDDARYVYLVTDDAEPKKHSVEVGETFNKNLEITKGLSAGEKVLKSKPE